jgi:ribosomal protein L44E
MSDTSKTEARRQSKLARQGRDRKKKLEKYGTTPKFPIHQDKAPKADA